MGCRHVKITSRGMRAGPSSIGRPNPRRLPSNIDGDTEFHAFADELHLTFWVTGRSFPQTLDHGPVPVHFKDTASPGGAGRKV